jgi:hypothetical protein
MVETCSSFGKSFFRRLRPRAVRGCTVSPVIPMLFLSRPQQVLEAIGDTPQRYAKSRLIVAGLALCGEMRISQPWVVAYEEQAKGNPSQPTGLKVSM